MAFVGGTMFIFRYPFHDKQRGVANKINHDTCVYSKTATSKIDNTCNSKSKQLYFTRLKTKD